MKKIILIALPIILAAAVFTGCADKNRGETLDSTTRESTTVSTTNKAEELASDAGNGVSRAGEEVKDRADKVGDDIGEGADKAADGAAGAFDEAGDAVSDALD